MSQSSINYLEAIPSLAVTSDNRFIISRSKKSTKVFDLQTKEQAHHFQKVEEVFVTSDSKFIIFRGDNEKSIKVIDFQTKEEFHHFQDVHEGKKISTIINKFFRDNQQPSHHIQQQVHHFWFS